MEVNSSHSHNGSFLHLTMKSSTKANVQWKWVTKYNWQVCEPVSNECYACDYKPATFISYKYVTYNIFINMLILRPSTENGGKSWKSNKTINGVHVDTKAEIFGKHPVEEKFQSFGQSEYKQAIDWRQTVSQCHFKPNTHTHF